MADFVEKDLSGTRFRPVDLTGAEFERLTMTGTRFRGAWMNGVVISGSWLVDVEVHGEIGKLTVNGVDVGPLVEAELDRRDPERARMRPVDPAGYREAWDILERLWAGTVERARRLDPALLDESVDGEWSFIATQRHLVFATDSWIRRAILGEPSPWHPAGLAWGAELGPVPDMPLDPSLRPTLDEVLELRRDRMSTVRQVLDGLTDEKLDGDTEPVDAPGWPEPRRAYPVAECLRTVLTEEWQHRLYAERDLAVLEGR